MLPWAGTRVMLDQIRPVGWLGAKTLNILFCYMVAYYFARYSRNLFIWHWMIWKLLLTRN